MEIKVILPRLFSSFLLEPPKITKACPARTEMGKPRSGFIQFHLMGGDAAQYLSEGGHPLGPGLGNPPMSTSADSRQKACSSWGSKSILLSSEAGVPRSGRCRFRKITSMFLPVHLI